MNISGHAPPAKPFSFAALILLIEADPTLDSTQKRDASSAVRRFAKYLKIDLDAFAGVRAYRQRIDTFRPEQVGLKRRTWSNVRAELGKVLHRYGVVERYRPVPSDLAPDWKALREAACVLEKGCLRGLSPFIYFCNRTGVAPQAVNECTVVDFLESSADTLRKMKRNRRHRFLCTGWNRAVDLVPGWPEHRFAVPSFRNTYGLPFTDFPQSFQAEHTRWWDVHSGKFPLAPESPKRPFRPKTLHTRSEQFRRFASGLVLSGIPIEQITSLATLVEPKNFRLGLEFQLARAGGEPTAALSECADGLYYLAIHWVKVGADDRAELKRLCERVRCRERGLTGKNMERLRPFNDPLNVLRILALPDMLEAEARKPANANKPANPKRRAQLTQTALAIAILLVAPMRLRNLVALDLEQHVQRTRRGRGGLVRLIIEPDEVKNRVPLEFELPPEVVDLFDRYVQFCRPLLGRTRTTFLFPGEKHARKHEVSLSEQIVKAILRFTGLQMNVHLFRHLAAKLYLDKHPGDYLTVSRLLGHKGVQTTIDFYTSFETLAAGRRFHETVLAPLRRSLATSRKGKQDGRPPLRP
jgi:integrase